MKKRIGTVLMMLVLGAAPVWAQTASAVNVMTGNKTATLWQLIVVGGWCMVPLGLCSVAAMYFVIRNILTLRAKNLLRADLQPEIEALLARRDIKGVREVCRNNPSLMTSVLDAGLERISENDFNPAHVMEAIEEAGNEQMVSYMRPINYLSMLGTAAPMMGLLGTVSGIIKAFATISAGQMGKPEMLAGNIGEALVATATGLVIAIPAMMAYSIFKNGFLKNMSTMGRMIGHFMNVYRNSAGR
ncbi:MAG TPA: MotA/TolQ/ExbB proton channel family protein [Pontiellaceae bacterium]|nr:MotA/TolQ/ExbB proton channel family protein [Pontiellaceae bacterium]HNX53057.1 MotA/TolQ/ExbB proton channel family protein [Pontiellaceae bacterium]